MSTPRDPLGERPPSSELPAHLDPRRPKSPPPRVTGAYRQAARGGPAPAGLPPRRLPAPDVVPGRPGGPLGPPGPTGPTGPGGRGRRVARVLSWLALGTAVVVLVAAGGLYLAFNHYNGQIDRFDAFGHLPGHAKPKKAPRNAQNFLLVGSDSRDGSNGEGTQGTGAEFVTGQRSDTVILVHLYGSSDKVQLVSFPRDSYVEIPAFTNPKTGRTTPSHHAKLNSAFSEGGSPLLIATIENLTQIRIDHFLQIDFTGFKGMVNKLGGVDVCLTKPAKDRFSGIDLSAGQHHITGDVALAFVRQRHGLANGDIDRIARQQQFIGSLANKVLSAGTLLDPFKLNGFLDVATSSLKADKGLTGGDIKNLALRLRGFSSGGVLFTTVPIADTGARRGGASVVLLDDTKADSLFTALRDDRAPGTPEPAKAGGGGTPAPKLIVAPSAIRVSVYNGSGVQGIARRAASDLSGLGFQLVGIPTNRGTGASRTVIYYGPTKADSALTLQAAIPGSVLQPDSSLGRTLQVVVGSSYTGVKAVTVSGGTASPRPTASAGTATAAAVPVTTAQDNPCTR